MGCKLGPLVATLSAAVLCARPSIGTRLAPPYPPKASLLPAANTMTRDQPKLSAVAHRDGEYCRRTRGSVTGPLGWITLRSPV
jgi:hypothetical protein